MKILGISAYYHDSAAALVVNGEIVAAAQEERFTRIKNDESFPAKAIEFCLHFAKISLQEIDAIVFYDKPFLKFERLFETYFTNAPKGFISFFKAMPVWLKDKLFLKSVLRKELNKIEKLDYKKTKLLFTEHHLSHAASAYYVSSFNKSAILTVDGVGEWTTASIALGEGNKITVLKEMHYPNSIGLLYSAFTYYLGFKVNSGEYKLMGLAPYGNKGCEEVEKFKTIIKTKLVTIFDDGSIQMNQKNFTYSTHLKMVDDNLWFELFGLKKRMPEQEINQSHCNLALAIQEVTEEIILSLAKEAKTLTQCENICLAGGVALNGVANGKLQESNIFKNIYIQPAAGDAGGAIGAALSAHHIYFGNEKENISKYDKMNGAYLGPNNNDFEIKESLKKLQAVYNEFSEEQTVQLTAKAISEGNIIGWFQGRMEFGPRSLGARSILADARNANMQQDLNLKTKFRENFRPFAPSVLVEDVNEYFECTTTSPYMLLVKPVKNPLPKENGFENKNIIEKLKTKRHPLQAITHVDYSARIQTVHKETNLKFWKLLTEFKKLTNCSVLINTSFNLRSEPIVCSIEDAYTCFMRSGMDILVIENFILHKKDQVNWVENDEWKLTLNKD